MMWKLPHIQLKTFLLFFYFKLNLFFSPSRRRIKISHVCWAKSGQSFLCSRLDSIWTWTMLPNLSMWKIFFTPLWILICLSICFGTKITVRKSQHSSKISHWIRKMGNWFTYSYWISINTCYSHKISSFTRIQWSSWTWSKTPKSEREWLGWKMSSNNKITIANLIWINLKITCEWSPSLSYEIFFHNSHINDDCARIWILIQRDTHVLTYF